MKKRGGDGENIRRGEVKSVKEEKKNVCWSVKSRVKTSSRPSRLNPLQGHTKQQK